MTCLSKLKSNGIIEKFHCTIIEHLRIINQKSELKNATRENKTRLAMIVYNESINQVNKFTPKEIIFRKTEIDFPFETNKC